MSRDITHNEDRYPGLLERDDWEFASRSGHIARAVTHS